MKWGSLESNTKIILDKVELCVLQILKIDVAVIPIMRLFS
jgi:hypothetical protein